MYEDMIAALMQDMQVDMPSARAAALRPPPPPPAPMNVGPDPGQGLLPPPPMPVQTPMPIPDVPTGPPGPVPGVQATQPLPGPQSPSQRPPGPSGGSMLPQALGASGPPPAPPAPIPEVPDPLEQRQQELQRQYEQAMQPPDRGPMEAAYKARAQEGPRMLLHALAAEHVGKQGLAKHYYGAAGELDQPMKMAGGTMTPTGFIEDPGYAREFEIKKIEARMAQNDRIQQSNAVRADKERARKENEAFRIQLANQADETKRLIGGWAHSDRQAAADAKAAKGAEGKHLPVAQTNAYIGNATTISNIDEVIKSIEANPDAVGFKGYLPDVVLGRMGTAGEKATRADIANIGSLKIHDRSGANVTVGESPRLMPFIPKANDDDKTVVIKLKRLKAEAERANMTIEGFAGENNYIVPGRTVPSDGAAPPAAAPKAQAPAGGPVRVNTPAEAAKLAPGTRFITPDGQTRVRQ